jgi:DNA polymerase/3'-5' exonuclease PolX
MDNQAIAQRLVAQARNLAQKQGNLYRVRAYRRAAETIRGLDRPVEDLLAVEGRKALKALPGIGASLAEKIETLVYTGDIATLTEDDKTLVAI